MSPSITTFLDGRIHTRLRGLVWLALSETGHVLVYGGADDAGGGIAEAYTQGPEVPCRVDPVGAQGEETAGQIDERTTHVITLPAATAVASADRFSIDGGDTYDITAIRTRTHEAIRELEAVKAA